MHKKVCKLHAQVFFSATTATRTEGIDGLSVLPASSPLVLDVRLATSDVTAVLASLGFRSSLGELHGLEERHFTCIIKVILCKMLSYLSFE